MNGKKLFSKIIILLCLILFLNICVNAQWTKLDLLPNKSINDLLIDDNGYIYVAGEKSGIYRSKHNLHGWEAINDGLKSETRNITNILFANNSLFIKVQGELYRSSNFGDNWELIKSDTFDEILLPIGSFNGIIYAANRTLSKSFTSLFASLDNGKTWIARDENIELIKVNCFGVKESNLFIGTEKGVYKSDDMGLNWEPANSGLERNIVELEVIDNYLFVSTDAAVTINNDMISIYYSNDDGNSWQIQSTLIGGSNHLDTKTLDNYNGILVRGAFYGGIQFLSTPGEQFQNGGLPFWHTVKCITTKKDTLLAGEEYYSHIEGSGGIWLYLFPYVGINEDENIIKTYSLEQNYPNPFNPITTINYSLPRASNVKIIIYDTNGREIETLVNENQSRGLKTIQFNGENLSSGVYYYRISSPDFFETKKMLLLK